MTVEQRHGSRTGSSISKGKREAKSTLGCCEAFGSSRPTPSDTPRPRPHLLTLPKQFHTLGTKYSNPWACGCHSYSKQHSWLHSNSWLPHNVMHTQGVINSQQSNCYFKESADLKFGQAPLCSEIFLTLKKVSILSVLLVHHLCASLGNRVKLWL